MHPLLDVSTVPVPAAGRIGTKHWLVALLIAEVIAVTVPVGVLSATFRFPDILREPATVALPLFAANQSRIVPAYYMFMLSALLYLPLSVLLRRYVAASASRTGGELLVGLGLATALFQAIGFSRWLFTVPYLSDTYAHATGDEPLQTSIGLLYNALNNYAGMTIGEHLGFLAMGGWTICLSVQLPKRGLFSRWFSGAGMLTGILLIASVGEHFGTSLSGTFGLINFLANTIWTLWLLLLALRIGRTWHPGG